MDDNLLESVRNIYNTNRTLSPEKSDKIIWGYNNEVHRELTSSVFIPLSIFFSFVIIASLVGNSLVCLVIQRKRSMRTVVNIFLLNLAIIQIIICVLIIPANLIKFVHRSRWVLGSTMCYVVFFVQCITMYQSSFILMSIAFDRYRVIVLPLRKRISRKTCYIMLGVSWSVAAIIASIQTLAVRTESLDSIAVFMSRNVSQKTCSLVYPHHLATYLYALIFVTQYFIPLLVMVTLYSKIVIVLRSCIEHGASLSGRLRDRSKKKVVTMLIVVVVLFFISWAPIHIYLFLTSVLASYSFTVYYACYWFAMSNVWYNPIIYCWLNVRYRRAVRLVLQGCFRCNWVFGSSSPKMMRHQNILPKLASELQGPPILFLDPQHHDEDGKVINNALSKRSSGNKGSSKGIEQSFELTDRLRTNCSSGADAGTGKFHSVALSGTTFLVHDVPSRNYVSLPF